MKTVTSRGSVILFFFFSILIIQTNQAQYWECGTPDNSLGFVDTQDPSPLTGSIDPDYLATFDPVVFNIQFWQINNPDGSNPDPLTETIVLGAVANLNIEYNQFNIFFKYRGYDQFDSPVDVQMEIKEDADGDGDLECVYQTDDNGDPIIDPDGYGKMNSCQLDDVLAYAQANGYYDANSLNVYVPWDAEDFGGIAPGLASTVNYTPTYNLLNYVLVHEIGHNLGLRHTHSAYDWDTNCEHVTRNPSDDNYNAHERGDGAPDTAAAPDFIVEYCHFNPGIPDSDCENGGDFRRYYVDEGACAYTGFNYDCEDTPYQISQTDVKNFMSYSFPSCLDTFTIGQGIRMREVIDWDPNQNLAQTITTVAALYEPYAGEYYIIGPYPQNYKPPRFQPGFDYEFLSCDCDNQTLYDCNEPTPFEYTGFNYSHTAIAVYDKYETDYPNIGHPNHSAIYIDQLNQYDARRCYDNWNRDAKDGAVTKFNDDVFNANITVTVQDSLQINNESLINNLPQGLYTIDKNYNDGTTQQQVIYKENE